MDSYNQGRFPEIVHVQAPRGLNQALDHLATQQHMTRSELVRRALLREVTAAGVSLREPEQAAGNV
jgi:predicted transcriptional regulator